MDIFIVCDDERYIEGVYDFNAFRSKYKEFLDYTGNRWHSIYIVYKATINFENSEYITVAEVKKLLGEV